MRAASLLVNVNPAGKHGCFVGPRDEHLVIITQDGKLAALFDVATASNPSTMPLLSFALDSAVVPPGLSSPLFPGPPLTHVRGRSLHTVVYSNVLTNADVLCICWPANTVGNPFYAFPHCCIDAHLAMTGMACRRVLQA